MSEPIILASGSKIRADLLRNANVPFEVMTAPVDEELIRESLEAEGTSPRDIADSLAEAKAQRVSAKLPGALVLGCDQVLEFNGQILSKPKSPNEAVSQLQSMRGKRHMLLSAAVIYRGGEPIWRHVGQVRLHMRMATDGYITNYVARNWDSIQHSVGAYKLEEEGVRLFTSIEGNYFNVLGLPLMELINYLGLQGVIEQ